MPPQQRLQANASLCRDCQACTLACSLDHEAMCSPSLARLVVNKDMARYHFQIIICQHCDAPDCLPACPSGALAVDRRGVIVMNDDECTRCGACAAACTFGAIFYHPASDRYLKCDLCASRSEGPLCVAVCPVAALTVGTAGWAA